MHCEEKLSKLIKSFFYDRLTTQMEASRNTIQSYRTGIRMFLIFLQFEEQSLEKTVLFQFI